MPGLDPGIHRCSQEAFFRRRGWIAGSSPGNDGSKRFPGDCRIASRIVRGGSTVACRFKRQLAAGPVAQWLEPAAHNGLVAGSSPAGPTSEINALLGVVSPQRDYRTRNRTRYVRLSLAGRFGHGDLLNSIRQITGVMGPVGVSRTSSDI